MIFFGKKKDYEKTLTKVKKLTGAFDAYMLVLRQVCEDLQRIQSIDASAYRDVLMVFAQMRPDSNREHLVSIISQAVDVLSANCNEVTTEAALALSQIETSVMDIAINLDDRTSAPKESNKN